jgi:hypothetical protein
MRYQRYPTALGQRCRYAQPRGRLWQARETFSCMRGWAPCAPAQATQPSPACQCSQTVCFETKDNLVLLLPTVAPPLWATDFSLFTGTVAPPSVERSSGEAPCCFDRQSGPAQRRSLSPTVGASCCGSQCCSPWSSMIASSRADATRRVAMDARAKYVADQGWLKIVLEVVTFR